MTDMPTRIWLLPGWLDSGPTHWQSRWQAMHGDQRVEQDDWAWPKRGDWMARLEEVLLQHSGPAVLVAHSLGCHLVAAWAAHTRHAAKVTCAMLVAPPDLDRADLPPQLVTWRPPVLSRLPFASLMIVSSDDPYATSDASTTLAASWGSKVVSLGALGHINGKSGLGDWPQGRELLKSMVGDIN